MYAIDRPQLYSNVQTAMERRITVQISIGTGIDSTASDDVVSITGGFLEMSNTDQALDSNYVLTPGLATFEGSGIKTAYSAGLIAPPIQAVDYPPEAGLWSDDISDADGEMEWTVEIQLSQAHTSAFSIYTDTIHILQARIQYYNGETLARDTTISPTGDVFQDTETTTYDRILVTVLKIDRPYHHVRIVEFEFGASITMSNSVIGGSVSLIREMDPLCTTVPISELDFSLVNVNGEYDSDNPDTLIDQLQKWCPLDLSFTVITDSGRVTVPMGTYYITEHVGTDTDLQVAAQDARAIIQSIVRPMTLSTTESFGDMFEDLLNELGIPYSISDEAYSEFPVADVTMDGQEYDLLTQCLFIQQFYGIVLTPGRDGFLHVDVDPVPDTASSLTADLLTSFPAPAQSQTYNCISVRYGQNGTYTLDMRTNQTEARSVLNINNPLVQTETDAQRIAQETKTRLYSQLFEAEAIADASLDPGDRIPIEGRWTQGDPETYKLTSIELVYDGGFLMTLKGSPV